MLTMRQRDVLLAIDAHIQTHGYSPTFADIAKATGTGSKSGISAIVARLVERGFLRHRKHSSNLEILRLPSGGRPIPVDLPDDPDALAAFLRERLAEARTTLDALFDLIDAGIAPLDAIEGDVEAEIDAVEDDGLDEPSATIAAA